MHRVWMQPPRDAREPFYDRYLDHGESVLVRADDVAALEAEGWTRASDAEVTITTDVADNDAEG